MTFLDHLPFIARGQSSVGNIRFATLAATAAFAAALVLAVPAPSATADDYEWDPTYGYHEEEWYDPSDWFNSDEDGIDYEDYEDGYYGSYYDGDVGWAGTDDYEAEDYEGEYEPWYGDNYYSDDWYADNDAFTGWYDDAEYAED